MSATRADRGLAGERIVPGTTMWDVSYPDHIQRYRFALDHIAEGANVLDAGCGAGYGAAEVAEQRKARVVAVDIAEDALALGKRHFDRETITWCRDDCETLESAGELGPFDAIINFENIEHLARPERFVARAAELLAPHGVLLASTPNRLLLNHLRGVPAAAPSSNPFHLNELSEAEFRTLLETYFEHVVIWYQSPTGSSRLRLRLRSAAARLRVLPLLQAVRRWLRRGRPRVDGAPPAGALRSWTIDAHDTGAAWTLIAVCRTPRRTRRQR